MGITSLFPKIEKKNITRNMEISSSIDIEEGTIPVYVQQELPTPKQGATELL